VATLFLYDINRNYILLLIFIFRRCTRDWYYVAPKDVMELLCMMNGIYSEVRDCGLYSGAIIGFSRRRIPKYRASDIRITSTTHSIKLFGYELAVGLCLLQVFLCSPPISVN
jgi:hypothetical protein